MYCHKRFRRNFGVRELVTAFPCSDFVAAKSAIHICKLSVELLQMHPNVPVGQKRFRRNFGVRELVTAFPCSDFVAAKSAIPIRKLSGLSCYKCTLMFQGA